MVTPRELKLDKEALAGRGIFLPVALGLCRGGDRSTSQFAVWTVNQPVLIICHACTVYNLPTVKYTPVYSEPLSIILPVAIQYVYSVGGYVYGSVYTCTATVVTSN